MKIQKVVQNSAHTRL